MAHSAYERTPHSFNLPKILLAAGFAATLFLAPQPIFAQHGGGGGGAGGGGGHSGGAGGGHSGGAGGHSSGGGHSGGVHSSAGTSAGQSSSYTGVASSGHVSTGTVAGGAEGSSHAWYGPSNSTNRAFADYSAVGHNTWQDPPSPAGTRSSSHTSASNTFAMISPGVTEAAAANRHGTSSAVSANHFVMMSRDAATRSNTPRGFLPNGTPIGSRPIPLPPHVGKFPPGRPFHPVFGGGCFGGFFPGWCGGGFWWGPSWWGFGGGLGWGYGSGYGADCDPAFGCVYGDYTSGYSMGGTYNIESQGDDMQSQEPNPSIYLPPPSENSGKAQPAAQPEVALFLKDGSVYAVSDYWLAGGQLHYVTNYGGENSLDISQIDLQRTVDANARRGVNFILRPAPPEPGNPSKPEPDR
jgi:hypothetical protein